MARTPLEPFAGIGVADTCDEEAEGEHQHDNVQHGNVPVRRGPRTERTASRLPGKRCHRAHRFSRRKQWRRYRNLIKTQPLSSLRTQGPIATEASFTTVLNRSALS